MGFLESLGRAGLASAGYTVPAALASRPAAVASPVPEATAAQIGIASPPAMSGEPTALSTIVWNDLVGSDKVPMTRARAMAVPAVARARHLICSAIARCELTEWRGAEQITPPASWMVRSDRGASPYHRMVWTVDDLLFEGWSLWRVTRGRDAILDAWRVPPVRWAFDAAGRVEVDGMPVDSRDVILLPGPHEGILSFGAKAIAQAADLEDNAASSARHPNPHVDIHYTGDKAQTPDEIRELREIWAQARRGEYGGVGYSSKYVEVRTLGSAAEHLLIEGRNAAAVNMARLCSLPAGMLDATTPKASLNYETTSGRNAEFLDWGVAFYMDAIAARLSLDDVVAAGRSTRFDTSVLRDLNVSPTGPDTED